MMSPSILSETIQHRASRDRARANAQLQFFLGK
jgi:hypothetical protein